MLTFMNVVLIQFSLKMKCESPLKLKPFKEVLVSSMNSFLYSEGSSQENCFLLFCFFFPKTNFELQCISNFKCLWYTKNVSQSVSHYIF